MVNVAATGKGSGHCSLVSVRVNAVLTLWHVALLVSEEEFLSAAQLFTAFFKCAEQIVACCVG